MDSEKRSDSQEFGEGGVGEGVDGTETIRCDND